MLRDILKYTDGEIDKLSLIDYELAFHYALETYIRRDLVFVMGKVFGDNKDSEGKGGTTIIVPQPEIEQWIKEQYDKDEVKEDE
ncbi:hypothetical protein LCGC14_1364950 [marine sediment metagenome]|uniref:Uncharacterized protein n=1 Tax=marine sediment metagenome TaxID=412755 RepID=A0A0F9K728_9ZZZZ